MSVSTCGVTLVFGTVVVALARVIVSRIFNFCLYFSNQFINYLYDENTVDCLNRTDHNKAPF